MTRAIAASESEITEVRAPVLLNTCSLCLNPPSRMDSPRTSRMLPMMDPVIEAFTTLVSPLESAMAAMISSAALPKVAFNSPPSPSPTCAASSSVARPIQPATGTITNAEQKIKLHLEIAHVLFIDIVGYSTNLNDASPRDRLAWKGGQ